MEDVADLVKAIHIKLTDEGRYVGMFEVLGQDFGELGGRRHDKTLVRVRPGNQVLNTAILQHAV
jgi:hypothetical protein